MNLHSRLAHLATFSDDPECLTRLSLSPSHKRAFDWLKGEFEAAGLTTRNDGLGSLIGRLQGRSDQTLVIGSHIDTVKNAGLYDGNLGVLAGLSVVEALQNPLNLSLEIHAFADEEGVRFPSTLSNSRLLAGDFNKAILDEKDAEGISRRDALIAFGETGIPANHAEVIAYLELHIEQGPALEAANLALGVVTAINGATRGKITVTGKAGHAGTTPMHLRHDALCAASEMILAIEARAIGDIVATVGRLDIPNAAVNVIPGEVSFTIDIRSPSDISREKAAHDIAEICENIALKRHLKVDTIYSYHANAAPCDNRLQNHLTAALLKNGQAAFNLPSGAGHDAMALHGKIPMAMLFVRSKDGLSHHPDEYSAPADLDLAVKTLLDTIISLDQSEGHIS
jgi:allantoate deiminase